MLTEPLSMEMKRVESSLNRSLVARTCRRHICSGEADVPDSAHSKLGTMALSRLPVEMAPMAASTARATCRSI